MQIDTNTLIYILFGLIAVGWKLFTDWTKRVDGKLNELSGRELACTEKFLTKKDYDEGKNHVWDKLNRLDDEMADCKERLAVLEDKR